MCDVRYVCGAPFFLSVLSQYVIRHVRFITRRTHNSRIVCNGAGDIPTIQVWCFSSMLKHHQELSQCSSVRQCIQCNTELPDQHPFQCRGYPNAIQRRGFIKTSEMRCPDLQSPSPIHLGSSVTIVKQRKCVVVAGVELQLSDHKLLVRSLVFGNTEQQMLYSRNPESAAWSSQSLKSAIELRKGG